ncbi:MAG: hypothetical protein U1A06_20145 [Hoeflea sp.]|nr:hypothetical protein [Hoeflea sp.]
MRMSVRRLKFVKEKTDMVKKSHVFGLALSALLFVSGAWFLLDHKKAENSGKEIAEYMVETASAHDGVVDLSPFGTKVCIQPPGGLGRPMAVRQHGKPVVFEESIASEGIWSLSLERPDGVYVYAIPTSIVNWELKGTEIYAELASCPKSLLIQVVNSVPTLIVK